MSLDIDTIYSNSDRSQTIDTCLDDIFNKYKCDWLQCINKVNSSRGSGGNKLRTYKLFKHSYKTEMYITNPTIPRRDRSALAKFRCGVAPLKIETGRYQGLPPSERFCFNCCNTVEDEFHVLMSCRLYQKIRQDLFNKILLIDPEFATLNEHHKFEYIMSNDQIVKYNAKACHDILIIRNNLLYS